MDAKILILGLGDVGDICLEMLVWSGINKFVFVDYDKFECCYLNKQILSIIKFLDKDKALITKKELNSLIQI